MKFSAIASIGTTTAILSELLFSIEGFIFPSQITIGLSHQSASTPKTTATRWKGLSNSPKRGLMTTQSFVGTGQSMPFERDHDHDKVATTIESNILDDNRDEETLSTCHSSSSSSADIRQLLGMAEAAEQNELWKIRLQLTKPITWIPLSLGVMCGAAASGNYHWIWNPLSENSNVALGLEDAAKGFCAMVLAGPFMEGFSQTLNDWFDRHIDAINEPYRPIPRGAISEHDVMLQVWFLLLGGLGLAHTLDIWAGNTDFPWVFTNACVGSIIGYLYSAPPFKLKQNWWSGDLAIAFCYIALPWWCGQSVFGPLDKPIYWTLPLFYSLAAVGAAIANDFKSIEGDRHFGLNSFPVVFGVDGAKYAIAATQNGVQVAVAAYLYSIGEPVFASTLLGLVLPQIHSQVTLLFPDPTENDMKYQASSQPFLFLGLFVTAVCVSQHDWSGIFRG